MSKSEASSRRISEGLVSAFSAGAFLILLGVIIVTTPGFFDAAYNFVTGFSTVEVPSFPGLFLPAPKKPETYTVLYSAAWQFSLAWGIFLIALLAIRIAVRSPRQKKVENVSNIVFWLGANFLIGTFLNATTTLQLWFAFWAALIVLAGVSLIVRALILLALKL
jgi:hypothetical protein